MKLKISIVVIALAAGIAFMALSSINKDARKFFQVNEFQEELKKNPDIADKNLILLGNVKEGSIRKSGIEADFVMELKGESLTVHHNGRNILPDGFLDGAQITVEGKYDNQKNIFVSDKVMAKCASKYQAGKDKQL
ncbi:MAG: cytochrome c maturation protein CcmE [Spirochaetia bacterium]|nr:cytochrome c maturation protein CcmE [Spirochaetia bacterium]